MQTLINAIASRLGVSTATAATTVGSLLSLIERNADKTTVTALFAALPRARTLASDADHETAEAGLDPRGDLYAALANRAGPGTKGVGLAGLAAAGLSLGQIGTATAMFIEHARIAAGPMMDNVVASVPALAALADRPPAPA
jgi:hypothetical protein